MLIIECHKQHVKILCVGGDIDKVHQIKVTLLFCPLRCFCFDEHWCYTDPTELPKGGKINEMRGEKNTGEKSRSEAKEDEKR